MAQDHPARTPDGRHPLGAWLAGVVLVGVTITGALALLWLTAGHDRAAPAPPPTPASAPPAPADDGYAVWERNDDGSPVRWDSCTPIEIVVHPAALPPGARADLEAAATHLGRLTGLDLVVTAETDEQPTAARRPYQPERYGERWAPVLVAWVSPDQGGPLRASEPHRYS